MDKKMTKKDIAKLAVKLGLDVATTTILVTTLGGTFTSASKFLSSGSKEITALKFAVNANGLKWMSSATTLFTNGTLKKIIDKF